MITEWIKHALYTAYLRESAVGCELHSWTSYQHDLRVTALSSGSGFCVVTP